MKNFTKLLLTVLPLLLCLQLAQAQCPGCSIDLPPLGEDTVYLSEVPDAFLGTYYQEDMSFRLPKTTTPVNAQDPGTPAGLTITEITITSLENLPPGIEWQASQTVFETANQTDGCIRLCGIPLIIDTFEIKVNISAVVLGIPQTTAFFVNMIVHPPLSTNDGFTMTNSIGCGSTTVTFTNNVPSNGLDGFSYAWDFGNGMTSTEENPQPVSYDSPGTYIITYEAIVDTSAYFLNGVTVEEVACTDFFGDPPDLFIVVNDPSGEELFDSGIYNNTNPPINYVAGYIEMQDGQYSMEVIDDDIVGDDICGIIAFDKFSNGTHTVGDLTVTIEIIHMTATVIAQDTVIVYPQPDMPVISSSIPTNNFCEGASMLLTSSYNNNNQWFLNGNAITGANSNTLMVTEGGMYAVTYTSPEGCIAMSEAVTVTVTPAPEAPVYVNDNNLLTLFDQSTLPSEYHLQWYQSGVLLEGENDFTLCIEVFDEYTLEVTDLSTGCTNTFTMDVPYNPNVDCTTATEELATFYDIRLSPNPSYGILELSIYVPSTEDMSFSIFSLDGKMVYRHTETIASGIYRHRIDLQSQAGGLYLLQMKIGDQYHTEKIIIN